MSSNNNKLTIEDALKEVFTFENEEDKFDFEASKIQTRFLAKIQKIMDRKGVTKSELASKMGTTKAFVTQLFSSNKFINMKTMAKMEKIFDLKIEINPIEKTVSINNEKYQRNSNILKFRGNYGGIEQRHHDLSHVSENKSTYKAG